MYQLDNLLLNFLKKIYSSPIKRKSNFTINTFQDIVIITSTIHPTSEKLSYSKIRSIYDDNERFEQTLNSINSIKNKLPRASIFLLENSPLTCKEQEELKNAVDWLILFSNDPNASEYKDSIYKGSGEIYMLLKFYEVFTHFDYKRLFKLSGRYFLSENFSPQKFSESQFSFRKYENSYSTRLYSVPKNLEEIYYEQLIKTFKESCHGATIECILMQDIDENKIKLLDMLGVKGNIAVNGELINE